MSRRSLIMVWAAVGALLLTAGAWRHVMFYKVVPPERIALWFPLVVLLRLPTGTVLFFWPFQFPVLAGVFVLASLRWSAWRALVVMLTLYALSVTTALFVIHASR